MTKFNPTRETTRLAMLSDPVRLALIAKAQKLAQRVDQIGNSEGVEMDAEVKVGIRPKGRPYARVESDKSSQEWGDRWTERKRILGRAAEGS